MKPIHFKEVNVVLAEISDQEEYLPLPAFYNQTDSTGPVISCWQLDWKERLKLLFTGKVWLQQLTFRMPLQPQLPMIDYPFEEEK